MILWTIQGFLLCSIYKISDFKRCHKPITWTIIARCLL